MKSKRFILKCIFIPVIGVAIATALIYLVMSLWNWLVPELFNGPVVSFWQAAGILLLSKIIFGFGKGGPGKRCHKCGGGHSWKERWKQKMEHLSPEEKAKIESKWQKCWWGDKDKATQEPKTE